MLGAVHAGERRSMNLKRSTSEGHETRCAWCHEDVSSLPRDETAHLLVGVRDEIGLEESRGSFIDFPFEPRDRSIPAYVERLDARLDASRTAYNLVFLLCGTKCTQALGDRLKADENVLSIESWPQLGNGESGEEAIWNRASSIEPSADGIYIIVKLFGSYTCSRSMEDTLAAHALGEKLGLDRYLVDLEECRNTDSIVANYEFAKKNMMEEPGFNKRAIVALLVSPDDHSHDFVETVSRNAGLSVRIFRDRNSAEEYLLKGE
jgi:hypothetical protein